MNIDLLRIEENTERLILALHKAISLKCPLVVESEWDKIKIEEFRIGMLNCIDCEIMKTECKKVKIYTYPEFLNKLNSKEIKLTDSLVINNIQAFVQKVIGVKLKNLFLTSS